MSAILLVLSLLILLAIVATIGPEGLWGNTLLLVNVVLAGLLAMNFFELLAPLIAGVASGYKYFVDYVAWWLIFIVSFLVMRLITDQISRTRVRFHRLLDDIGGYVMAVAVGSVMVAMIVFTLHLAPLPRAGWGFDPERRMVLGIGPDRQWLGFTQRMSRQGFAAGNEFDPQGLLIPKYASRRAALEAAPKFTD